MWPKLTKEGAKVNQPFTAFFSHLLFVVKMKRHVLNFPLQLRRIHSFPKKQNASLMEKFRTTWPHPKPTKEIIASIPARTIPDDVLRFKLSATFDHGMAIFYPHLKYHPADFKVTLMVKYVFL